MSLPFPHHRRASFTAFPVGQPANKEVSPHHKPVHNRCMAYTDPNDPDFADADHGPDAPDVDPATTFYVNRRGNRVVCRIAALDATADDPMNDYAPMGDIYNDCRRADLRDGCPRCTEDVTENASEPDVMARWGLR